MKKVSSGVVQVLGNAIAAIFTTNVVFLGYWGFAPGTATWSIKHLAVLLPMLVAILLVCCAMHSLSKDVGDATTDAEFANVKAAKRLIFVAMGLTIVAFTIAIIQGIS
jgi:fatty acid desaturase